MPPPLAAMPPGAPGFVPAHDAIHVSASQARILDLLRETPGVTIQQVAQLLACSHPNATYHLDALRRKGLIVREREGRSVRHYLGQSEPQTHLRVAALRTDERLRAVLDCLSQTRAKDVTINGVATQLNLPYGFLKRSLLRLQQHGLIELNRRNFRYSISVKRDL